MKQEPVAFYRWSLVSIGTTGTLTKVKFWQTKLGVDIWRDCCGTVSVLSWYCFGNVLGLSRYCLGTLLVLSWYCLDTTSALAQYCRGTVSIMS